MAIKIVLSLLSLLNGIFMIADGFHVILKGKFIGPERPGPWSNLFYLFNINVFKLGPLFIVLGTGWLLWLYALWSNQPWAFILGLAVSVLTLWYIKVGTLISIVTIALLLIFKQQLGF